jgi:hypothetical protein
VLRGKWVLEQPSMRHHDVLSQYSTIAKEEPAKVNRARVTPGSASSRHPPAPAATTGYRSFARLSAPRTSIRLVVAHHWTPAGWLIDVPAARSSPANASRPSNCAFAAARKGFSAIGKDAVALPESQLAIARLLQLLRSSQRRTG